MKRLLLLAAVAATACALAIPASARAAIATAGTICGTRTAQVHVPENSYYTVFNASGDANTTCVHVTPGQSSFEVTATDQHQPWGFPNIASGWESGVSSCAGAGGACFRYPVEEEHDGTPETSLGVAMHGSGDAAYDIWFNPWDTTPVQDSGAEVMIWLRHPGVSRPASAASWRVSIEGVSFDVFEWRAHNAGDGKSWNYIAYIAASQRSNLHDFWLNDVFRDAIARGDLSAGWYLTGITAGFELTSGGAGSVASMQLRGVA